MHDKMEDEIQSCRGNNRRNSQSPISPNDVKYPNTYANPHRTNFPIIIVNSWTILALLIVSDLVWPTGAQFFTGSLNSGSITNTGSGSVLGGSSDEWDSSGFRSGGYGHGYTCVNIPVNFTLCKNINSGYSKMMIPNLLGHDSLQEAEYHANAWVPLLGLQCHPDTQLFLCSLFSPICLDRPIYPCRSLCQVVKSRCAPRMSTYNYPWPPMLACDQFPEDHDLCIRPGAANNEDKSAEEPDCPSCHQVHTCENIVDNYCRAHFVFRAKFKRLRGTTIEFRKGRWFKPREGSRRLRPEVRSFDLDPKDSCCAGQLRPNIPYIVMGISKGDSAAITFIMPWNGKDKVLKNAVRTFRSMDCSNPLPMSVMAISGDESSGSSGGGRNSTASNGRNGTMASNGRRQRRKQGRRRGRQYGGCRVTTPGKNP